MSSNIPDPYANLPEDVREVFATGAYHDTIAPFAARVEAMDKITPAEREALEEEIYKVVIEVESKHDMLMKPHTKTGPWRKATKAQLAELDEMGHRLARYEKTDADALRALLDRVHAYNAALIEADNARMGQT